MMTDFEVLFCGHDFYVVEPTIACVESIDSFVKSDIAEQMASNIDNELLSILEGKSDAYQQLIKIDRGPVTPKKIDWGNFSYKPSSPVKSIEEKQAFLLSYFETVFPHNGKRYFDDVVAQMSEEAIDGELRVWNLYERVEPAKPALPPLPAGATRHKALPQACLTLPDAAAFMKGMQ